MSRWFILLLLNLSLSSPLWAEDRQTNGTESESSPQTTETAPPPPAADKKPKPTKADDAEPDCD